MYSIKEILQETGHRNWAYPKKSFSYYQEWNRVLFLHWKVDQAALSELIPQGLCLDLYNGEPWVSLVAFTMEKIRPRGLPALSWISNFDEINLRTYVIRDGKPGVYFLNIEAGKSLSSRIARYLSGLPYTYSRIRRNKNTGYQADFKARGFRFRADYQVGEQIQEKSPLDHFLTERYCLYNQSQNQLYRYEIQHLPWEIRQVGTSHLETHYPLGALDLSHTPDKLHYSQGVQVLAWNKEKL